VRVLLLLLLLIKILMSASKRKGIRKVEKVSKKRQSDLSY